MFKQNIKKKSAVPRLLITVSTLAIFYNTLILLNIIPYRYAWGGRISSHEQMVKLQTIGIILNILIILIVAMKAKYVHQFMPKKVITFFLWAFAVLFAFNTIGNLFASNAIEKIIFSPITGLTTYLFFTLAIEPINGDETVC